MRVWILPLDPTSDRAPAGKPSRPAAGRPSSGSNDLGQVSTGGADIAVLRLTKAAPHVAVGRVYLQNGAQVFHSLGERVFCAQDACNALHRWYRPLVVLESQLVAFHGAIEVLHLLREGACDGLERTVD